MTDPLEIEIDRRRGRPAKPKTFAASLAYELRSGAEWAIPTSGITLPSPTFRSDPVKFFQVILGVEPWSKQVEMIELVRDNPRVAIGSGHKVSKSHTAAGIALWFYCSFDDARVVMSSTTSRQVDEILWRELRILWYRSGRCVACKLEDPHGMRISKPCPHSAIIPGQPNDMARSGLKTSGADGFREIVGFTAREAEAVAGVSGKNLLYLVDEASGVPDPIFEAIEGNRAGGARIVMFSNPTRTEGAFFDAFHSKSGFYKTMTVSSEDSPNVKAGRIVIPGLCEKPFIEEKRQEHGEDSAWFKIRILGQFAMNDNAKAISLHDIMQAQERWHETPAEGRLFVGLDPAGEGKEGDETVFAVRRGLKVLRLYPMRGLTVDAILQNLIGILEEWRKPRDETPVVVIDSEGGIGARLAGTLRAHLDQNVDAFELVAVKASNWSSDPDCERVRDHLWQNLSEWLRREGGAIPEDGKLERELHTPQWIELEGKGGKRKIQPKRDLKKILGRSPDRADAVALCVWRPRSLDSNQAETRLEAQPTEGASVALDPYSGLAAWRDR